MSGSIAAGSILELAFDQLPLPIILVDPKRRILHVNRAACGVLRAEGDELCGRDLAEVVRAPQDTWLSTDPVDRLGSPRTGRRLRARIKGSRRLLRVGVYPLQEGGEEAGLLVTVRDARADEKDPDEERDHLVSLGELSACVAHEIRNPLTGIRTTVQYVDSKLGAEDPKHEDLREVIGEIDRIEQIIGDLLLFARPPEGNRVVSDLNGLIERVLDGMAPQFEAAEVEVKRNLSGELEPFLFSPDSMQQVLLNMLRNAVEAMPEGGKLKVTTTVRRYRSGRPPSAEIFISDTGHGIPEDLLKSIFKPFFTTRHNGTGLGLAISAGIVRSHGGGIHARNRAQGGVTFRVSLPLLTDEPEES